MRAEDGEVGLGVVVAEGIDNRHSPAFAALGQVIRILDLCRSQRGRQRPVLLLQQRPTLIGATYRVAASKRCGRVG